MAEPVNTPEAWSERAREIPEPWTACGWSYESQGARFEAVAEALDPQPGESLYDFGCGLGDLCGYLDPLVKYYGYDWADGMVARAASEYGGPTCRFKTHQPSPAHRFDLVACVGCFNLPGGWSKESTWHTLRHLWDTYQPRALAASLYAGDDENCLRYTHPELLKFGRQLSYRIHVERILPNDLLLVARR